MHSSGRWREDGPEGDWFILFLQFFVVCVCTCVCACGNGRQLPQDSGWLQTARSNKQSLDIRFRSLSALWKTRCKSFLYLCHNDYAIWVCDIERSVLSSHTVHLPSQQYTETIVELFCEWAETGTLDVITQTKVCLQSVGLSWRLALSVRPPCFRSSFCAQWWFGKLAQCSSSVDESNSHSSPFPRYHPWFLSPSITLPLLFLSHSSAHLVPQDQQPSSHFKQLLVFVEA